MKNIIENDIFITTMEDCHHIVPSSLPTARPVFGPDAYEPHEEKLSLLKRLRYLLRNKRNKGNKIIDPASQYKCPSPQYQHPPLPIAYLPYGVYKSDPEPLSEKLTSCDYEKLCYTIDKNGRKHAAKGGCWILHKSGFWEFYKGGRFLPNEYAKIEPRNKLNTGNKIVPTIRVREQQIRNVHTIEVETSKKETENFLKHIYGKRVKLKENNYNIQTKKYFNNCFYNYDTKKANICFTPEQHVYFKQWRETK